MRSIFIKLLYQHIMPQMSCIFCNASFTGLVCNNCEKELIIRHPPFCTSCGIRLISEQDYCTKCRMLLEDSNKEFLIPIREIKDTPITKPLYMHSLWTYNEYSSYLITKYKKEGYRLLVHFLSSSYLHLLELYGYQGKSVCIIPMPANPTHVRKVGFDHMRLVCRHLSKIGNFNILDCIGRKTSLEQKTLGLEDRFVNIRNTLYIKSKRYKLYKATNRSTEPSITTQTSCAKQDYMQSLFLNPKSAHTCFNHKTSAIPKQAKKIAALLAQYSTIVLMDDIITTGATIQESAQLLSSINSEVSHKLQVVSLVRTEY